jgi:hypothetical protein
MAPSTSSQQRDFRRIKLRGGRYFRIFPYDL